MPKQNTIKEFAKKVAYNGDENDYTHIPIGADSDNIDRPDGTTVEEGLSNLEISKIEIIQVDSLPLENIKSFPVIYALVEKSNATLYEYKNNEWIPYGGKPDFVGTMAELQQAIKDGNVTNDMTAFITDYNNSDGSSSGSGGSLVTIILDNELSETSENGVKNKVITTAINRLSNRIDNLSSNGTIVLDSELSESSENGIKNKAVAQEFKNYISKSGGEINGTLKVQTLVLGTTPSDEIGAMWLEIE